MNVESILKSTKRNQTYRRPVITDTEGNQVTKVGRNETCPCGSELKYKICCGNPLKQSPRYSLARDYSDKMGEKGVFTQMAEETGITKEMKAEEVTDALKAMFYQNSAELLNKIHNKYNRNSTIQPGMFTDVLQIANFFGGYCKELKTKASDLTVEVETLKQQILKLKAGKDETNTVPETGQQAS